MSLTIKMKADVNVSQYSLTKDAEKSIINLPNGGKMPVVGFGTYQSKEGCKEIVLMSIEAGYRHIDTSSFYENEGDIGGALQEVFSKGIFKREDVFVTTKAHFPDKKDIVEGLKNSLKRLKLDYVDLYLIHWPGTTLLNVNTMECEKIPLHVQWAQMEALYNQGLAKNIGVSNFSVQLMLDLLTYAKVKPVVNQVEMHPHFPQNNILDFYRKAGIHLQAYSPLSNPGFAHKRNPNNILEDAKILELASKYDKTPAQIILNWNLQRGVVILPKSSSLARMKENLGAMSFSMDDEDVKLLSNLNVNIKNVDPYYMAFLGNMPIFY